MTHSVPAASVTHLSDAVDGEAPRDAVQWRDFCPRDVGFQEVSRHWAEDTADRLFVGHRHSHLNSWVHGFKSQPGSDPTTFEFTATTPALYLCSRLESFSVRGKKKYKNAPRYKLRCNSTLWDWLQGVMLRNNEGGKADLIRLRALSLKIRVEA
jgi:hypothetical protein